MSAANQDKAAAPAPRASWGGGAGPLAARVRELIAVPNLVALGYIAAMTLVAAVAAWPIYRDGRFIAVVVIAFVVALGLAVAARLWRWPGWMTALAAVAAVFLLGLALAVPGRWATPEPFPAVFGDVAFGAVTSWKDLLTVELPVASYRNLLMPAVVVFVAGPLSATVAALAGRAGLAVGVSIATASFGLLFGHTVTSSPWRLGALTIPAPRELAVGAVLLLLSISWLVWRTRAARRLALAQTSARTGVRLRRRSPWGAIARGSVTVGLVAVAVIAAGAAAPALVDGRDRLVPRAATGPDLALREAVSPLSEYRAAFADEAYERELFRVGGGALPERIRIAALTAYDGETYRALEVGSDRADDLFVRVPAWSASGDAGAGATIQIAELGGIWLPTFGDVTRIQFDGERASSLADGLYYSEESAGAVETAGLEPGTTYTVVADEVWAPLAQLASPREPAVVPIPDTVIQWVESNGISADGAGLEKAIKLLRERGYLSHALRVDEEGEQPLWIQELGDEYAFRPSESGHSLARIDELFRDLLDAEAALETSTAAAVGDDEQFAVAASLVAQQLGFPTRVVVGTRLQGEPGLPVCEGGVCLGADLSVWLEVRGASGEWAAVDTTPQWEQQLDTDEQKLQDPKVPTIVRPDDAREVQPPDPIQQKAQQTDDREDDVVDALTWIVVRGIGISLLTLLLVLGPFLVVIIAKALRRSARHGAEEPTQRIEGGWTEYVDAAVDHGLPAPGARTRAELARLYGTPNAAALAAEADRAVFARTAVGPDEADRFWEVVREERKALGAERSWWARLRAAVSLRSFVDGTRGGAS